VAEWAASAKPYSAGGDAKHEPGTTWPGACAEEALSWGTDRLTQSSCESPHLDAELLLSHLLACNRAHLHAHPERPLTCEERRAFAGLIGRRAQREPVAYIMGHWEFYGLDFRIDRRVLVPRPETELLVELVVQYARERRAHRAIVPDEALAFSIADVGTGSGAVAIAIAVALSDALVYALDVSAEALQVAEANGQRHGVARRVILRQGDLLAALDRRVDCIAANLPYVRSDERDGLPPEIARYEPWIALDGGADGLAHIRRLLEEAKDHLGPTGAIFLEIGAAQGPDVMALARRAFPRADIRLHQDYAGHDRIVALKMTLPPQ